MDVPIALDQVDTLGDTTTWGLPSRLELVDGFLLVVDPYAPEQVVIVHRVSGDVVGAFARKGGGPAEAEAVFLIYAESHTPPRVWVYDARNIRLSLWALDDGIPREPIRSFRLNLKGALTRPFITDQGIIYTAKYSDVAFYVADSSGTVRQEVGTAPYAMTDYLYDAVVNDAFPVMDPARRRLALGYFHTNRVDFYEATGARIASGSAPVEIPELNLTLEDGERRYERPLPRTYGLGTATERFVYYLFCPDCDTREPSRQQFVHVFDWTGRFVMTLDLGVAASVIEVAPDDDVLYAAVSDPYPLIVVYQLPTSLRASGKE